MTRKPLIAGNWKMNLTVDAGIDLVRTFAAALTPDIHERVDIAVLPPFPLLGAVRAVLAAEAPVVMCGAQDLSPHDSGAYTGDVSGAMLTSVGCRYVVVGHSERRQHHGEDDATVNSKVHAALRNGLTPSCASARAWTCARAAATSSTARLNSTRTWYGCRRSSSRVS
jgi:triosephosphate isomerase